MDKEVRMILAVYDAVILPDVDYHLNIGEISDEEKSRIKIDQNRAVVLPVKSLKDHPQLTTEDFHSFGVLVEVIDITENHLGTFLHMHSREKVRVTDIVNTDGIIEGECLPVDELMDITVEGEKQLLEKLKKTTADIAENIRGGQYAVEYLKNVKTVNEYAAAFCQFFDMTEEEKYALLETDSFRERGSLIHEALLRFKGTIDLQVDLARRDDPEGRSYKKAAIQKQIGILEKELQEMEPNTEEEEDSFRYKIEHCGMPEETKKEALRVLRRFEQEPSNGPEYNSLYDYLDFITSLAWTCGKPGEIDLSRARKILDRDHYGLKKVKERILQHLAVMSLNGKQKGQALLLVGAPGTGKTSMGKSIAEALGRKYVRISLGGIRDEAEIRGHRRTYIGAMPGRIMSGIKRAGVMDPVIVLDEVDKVQQSYNGDPHAALLEVLDPEQNNSFNDHYVDLPYDLSHAFFICTANTWDTIPQPLLDRMEIIELPGYTPVEHFEIGRRHLVPQAIAETGLTREDIRFTDGALRKIIADYTMEAGVRGLKKQLLTVCRKAAVKIVEGDFAVENEDREPDADAGETTALARRQLVIREKDVEDYLGRKKINHDKIMKDAPAGVVTGLAWTQAGGEILFIETAAMKGSGQIHLTGQIGDVMRESAETAVSLVKATFMEEGLNFKNRDIHIHIPEGAVPKDGPSAGITMFTAVTSLVTGRPVSPYLAMTGEISLRGQVLPIGGLPEKLMAAVRSGVQTVLIPKENMKDLEDVPEETKEKLEIIPVATVKEVIREALHMRLPDRTVTPFAREEAGDKKAESAESAD